MKLDRVRAIADAVLYEGYVLYPYRPSAVKNRQRFNFGVLVPPAYAEAQGGTEAWRMRTECVVLGDPDTTIQVVARFLHLLTREERGSVAQGWQEAVEREVDGPRARLGDLAGLPHLHAFYFPARSDEEGAHAYRQEEIEGAIELSAEVVEEGVYRIAATVLNATSLAHVDWRSRDEALAVSLVSTHTILGVRGGEFVSTFDPPESCAAAVAACRNEGAWPVLVGEEGSRDLMLASPIILYDYPKVAPESPGDLFDGAEIDEILTLRILTLTDEEKREVREGDERARRILERTESLPAEHLMKLHGVLRGLRPAEK